MRDLDVHAWCYPDRLCGSTLRLYEPVWNTTHRLHRRGLASRSDSAGVLKSRQGPIEDSHELLNAPETTFERESADYCVCRSVAVLVHWWDVAQFELFTSAFTVPALTGLAAEVQRTC
jgi:hypothetical protein